MVLQLPVNMPEINPFEKNILKKHIDRNMKMSPALIESYNKFGSRMKKLYMRREDRQEEMQFRSKEQEQKRFANEQVREKFAFSSANCAKPSLKSLKGQRTI